MRCPHCGFEDPEDFAFCSECGQPRLAGPADGGYGVPVVDYGPGAGAYGAVAPPNVPRPALDFGGEPPGETRTARLVGLEGPVEGQEFVLDRPELSVGRLNCDIVVNDQSVSRMHARIRQVMPGGFVIEDSELAWGKPSSNGTWVNGVRLAAPQPLVERDVIRIGKAAFSFRSGVESGAVQQGPLTILDNIGREPAAFETNTDLFGDQAAAGDPAGFYDRGAGRDAQAAAFDRYRAESEPQRSGYELPSPSYESPSPAYEPPRPAYEPPTPAYEPPTPAYEPPTPGYDAPAPVAGGGGRRSGGQAAPQPPDVSGLQRELGDLRRDLGSFIERLNELAGSVDTLDEQIKASIPPPMPPQLRHLAAELEAEGGAERYRALERVLDELKGDPTDLKLLLRLSDELPAVNRLVQVYLRALGVLREMSS